MLHKIVKNYEVILKSEKSRKRCSNNYIIVRATNPLPTDWALLEF